MLCPFLRDGTCQGIIIPDAYYACMNTLAARCLCEHQATSGQAPSGHCHSPLKKACPRHALHYQVYQLPDHLYSLREILNKRHTPMQTYTK